MFFVKYFVIITKWNDLDFSNLKSPSVYCLNVAKSTFGMILKYPNLKSQIKFLVIYVVIINKLATLILKSQISKYAWSKFSQAMIFGTFTLISEL